MSLDDRRGRVEPPAILAEVDPREWSALLRRGKLSGSVHAEQIAHVLRDVELTCDALKAVHAELSSMGLDIDDAIDHESDATPTTGLIRGRSADADEVVLLRRRSLRLRRQGARGESGSDDPVRLYLQGGYAHRRGRTTSGAARR